MAKPKYENMDLYVTDSDLDREVELYMEKGGVFDRAHEHGACRGTRFAPEPPAAAAPKNATKSGIIRDRICSRRSCSPPKGLPRAFLETIPEEAEEEKRVEKKVPPKVVEAQAKVVFRELHPRILSSAPRTCDDGILEPRQRERVAFYYSSLHAKAFVCRATAELYRDRLLDLLPSAKGVPILLVETTSEGMRGWLIIADVATGIPYIREEITSATRYTRVTNMYHVFSPSWKPGTLAALSFRAPGPAHEFALRIVDVMLVLKKTEVPTPQKKRNKRRQAQKKTKSMKSRISWLWCFCKKGKKSNHAKVSKQRKQEISTPCCFSRVVSMKATDYDKFKYSQLLATGGVAVAAERNRNSTSPSVFWVYTTTVTASPSAAPTAIESQPAAPQTPSNGPRVQNVVDVDDPRINSLRTFMEEVVFPEEIRDDVFDGILETVTKGDFYDLPMPEPPPNTPEPPEDGVRSVEDGGVRSVGRG